jgi:hypothetical protein
MATQTLAGDGESVSALVDTVISNLGATVSVFMPAIGDKLSHGSGNTTTSEGRSFVIQANGAGDIRVKHADQVQLLGVVPSLAAKIFTAHGTENSNHWDVLG